MTDMDTAREVRATVSTLVVGDLLVRTAKSEVGSRVVALEAAPAGTALQGPRGGRYVLRSSSTRTVVRLANGRGLVLSHSATVTVLR